MGVCVCVLVCTVQVQVHNKLFLIDGIISKFLASTRAAVAELRALVARQAAAILRLLNHLAC